MSCNITYTKGKATVRENDGTESVLFKRAENFYGNQEKAIKLWAISKTDDFKDVMSKENPTLEDVLKYIDIAKTNNNILDSDELYSVVDFMKKNGFNSLSELSTQMNKIFKPNGVIGLDEKEALDSKLYTTEDLDSINLSVISKLLNKVDSTLKISNVEIDNVKDKQEIIDPQKKTIFGTSNVLSNKEISLMILDDIEQGTSLDIFKNNLKESIYSGLLTLGDKTVSEIYDNFNSIQKVEKLNIEDNKLSVSTSDTSATIKATIPTNTDTRNLKSRLNNMIDFTDFAWSSEDDIKAVIKKNVQILTDYNVDLIGLEDLWQDKNSVIALYGTAIEMLENPTKSTIETFSNLKDKLLINNKSDNYIKLSDNYKGLNIVRVESSLMNEELYSNYGLIKIEDNLYHKVDTSTDIDDIYNFLYDMYLKGEFSIPNELKTVKDIENGEKKLDVIKDLTKFINTRDTGLDLEDSREIVSAFQVAFKHSKIPFTNSHIKVKNILQIETDSNYLTKDFISDMYNYYLDEKLKNSDIYTRILSKLSFSEKGIVPIDTIESLDGMKMKTEFEDYIRLRKDSDLDYLINVDNSTPISEDLLAINYPNTIPEQVGKYFVRDKYVIVPNTSKNFIKIGGTIYRKVLDDINQSMYQKVTLPNDTLYLNNNTDFTFDMDKAEEFYKNNSLIVQTDTTDKVEDKLRQANFKNTEKVKEVQTYDIAEDTEQTPKEIISSVKITLEMNGLAKNVTTLPREEFSKKLSDIGVNTDLINKITLWHGTTREGELLKDLKYRGEDTYGKLMSGVYLGDISTASYFSGAIPGMSRLLEINVDKSRFATVDMDGRMPKDDEGVKEIIGEDRYSDLMEQKDKGLIDGIILDNSFEPSTNSTSTQYLLFNSDVADVVKDLTEDEAMEIIDKYTKDLNASFQKLNIDLLPQGFVHNGEVVLNEDAMDINNTLIHEYGHLFNSWAKENRPDIYQKGLEVIQEQGQEYIDFVKENRPELEGEKLLEEALTQAIGDRGSIIVDENRKKSIKDWINSLWESVKNSIGITSVTSEELQDMNLKDFVSAVSNDILSGNEISKKQTVVSEGVFDYNKSQNMLSILNSDLELLNLYSSKELDDINERVDSCGV